MVYRRRSARKTRRPARRGGLRKLRGVAGTMRNAFGRRSGPASAQRPRVAGRKRQRGPRSWGEFVFGKRRRTVKDSAGYIQWGNHKYSKNLGRLTLRKLVKANTTIVDYIWKRVGRLDLGGQLFANNWYDSTTTPDEAWRPIYLVDLTAKQGSAGGPVFTLKRKLGTTPSMCLSLFRALTTLDLLRMITRLLSVLQRLMLLPLMWLF